MNEMRVLILGGAAPYYPPRLTALWHSLGLMPRECPVSAGRPTATGRCPLLSPAAHGLVAFAWLDASRMSGLRRSHERD